jgi:chromosome segregation ATPase
MLKSEIDSLVN